MMSFFQNNQTFKFEWMGGGKKLAMSMNGDRASSMIRAAIISPPSARGYSAYELAVQDGFDGTISEWLASLVGQNGNDAEYLTPPDLVSFSKDVFFMGWSSTGLIRRQLVTGSTDFISQDIALDWINKEALNYA